MRKTGIGQAIGAGSRPAQVSAGPQGGPNENINSQKDHCGTGDRRVIFACCHRGPSGEDITPAACVREGQSPREKNSHSSTDCRSGQPARGSVLQMRVRLSKGVPSNPSSRRSILTFRGSENATRLIATRNASRIRFGYSSRLERQPE